MYQQVDVYNSYWHPHTRIFLEIAQFWWLRSLKGFNKQCEYMLLECSKFNMFAYVIELSILYDTEILFTTHLILGKNVRNNGDVWIRKKTGNLKNLRQLFTKFKELTESSKLLNFIWILADQKMFIWH